MPIIRTFICHHGGNLDRIFPILRQVAPYGVRPWIDKRSPHDQVGLPLAQILQAPILGGDGARDAIQPCSSLSLVLTKESVERPWPTQEVEWALERIEQGFRILPIFLDPPDELKLPEAFQGFLRHRKVLWLEPYKDPLFVEKYVASVLAAGGLDQESKELTLYLGHRSVHWDAVLPQEWQAKPTLDLRLNLDGTDDFSPTEAEWQEIEAGLRMLRKRLGRIERINVCGQAPLGVGHLIGKVWDRCAGTQPTLRIYACNVHGGQQQFFTTEPLDFEHASDFTPDQAQQVKMERPAPLRHKSLLLVLLRNGREDCLHDIHRWNAARPEPSYMHVATLPRVIETPAQARDVVRECVGIVKYLRRTYPGIHTIEIVSVYALAIAPLLAHHLRTLGPLQFFDEVKGSHTYRLVTSLE